MAQAIPLIIVAASLIGTGVSVYESREAGIAAKRAADYKAKELQQQAMEAQQSAGQQVAAQEQRQMSILASIRANAAASGVDPSAGSALVTYDTSSEQAKLNEMYTKYAGNLYAQGLQTQASLDVYGGRQAELAGNLNAAGAAVQGLGSVAGTIYQNPSAFHIS